VTSYDDVGLLVMMMWGD